MSTPFPFRADRLAAELGWSPAEMAQRLASLKRGVDWEIVNKTRALALEAAAQLRLAKKADAPVAEKKRPIKGLLGEARPMVELIAWHCPARNTRLLIAYVPGTDPLNPLNRVNVLVRSNVNFTRGMKVRQARLVSGITYEASGPAPRWRGKY